MLKAADSKGRLSRPSWRMLERTLLKVADLVIANSYHTLHAVVSLGIDEGKCGSSTRGLTFLGSQGKERWTPNPLSSSSL